SVLMGSSEVAAQATSVAPLGAAAASAPQAVALTPAQAAALPHNDATLTTLQQMWNLLTPESRSAFLKWAQQ
ncbi:MAG TPA: hypothetical protein DEO91_17340, partial [Pseudomonas sp.]|nr:hypothetical protein [Pseudomonas sp.]